MKKKIIYDQRPPDDEFSMDLTRADLDEPELMIYDSTLARLANPSSDQLRMLAAYSWAASELKKASEADDQALAIWLRGCMIYARNGLGISAPKFYDLLELLLGCDDGYPPVYLGLERAWQISEEK